jgi:large subunit ribosomal protein L29
VISLKATEIRHLSDDELQEKLAEAREALFNLRFQHATGQLENTARIKDVRRDIARMLTVQREGAEETRNDG